MIEKLTRDDRMWLSNTEHGANALRIIDAQAAVIEQVWRVRDKLSRGGDWPAALRSLDEALAAAPEHTAPEKLGQDVREMLAAANARVAELEEQNEETQRWADIYRERALKAEAENETLHGDVKDANARVAELESGLALFAANARADAAERAKAEWERLRGEAYSLYRAEAEKRERAESEAAALRAQCERDAALAAEWKQTAEEYRMAYQSLKDKK